MKRGGKSVRERVLLVRGGRGRRREGVVGEAGEGEVA